MIALKCRKRTKSQCTEIQSLDKFFQFKISYIVHKPPVSGGFSFALRSCFPGAVMLK